MDFASQCSLYMVHVMSMPEWYDMMIEKNTYTRSPEPSIYTCHPTLQALHSNRALHVLASQVPLTSCLQITNFIVFFHITCRDERGNIWVVRTQSPSW